MSEGFAREEKSALQHPVPPGVFAETVTEVKHYTPRLFQFRMTRPRSFRFRSGEFVMIGLPNAAKPVYRAYSISSPAWDEELEFFSIKVPGGPLTEHLQKIKPGDTVLMRKKSTGTLILDALLPGSRIYMLSTGTGIAPFASLMRDPEIYEKFEEVVVTHTCREKDELTYGFETLSKTLEDPLVGDEARAKLIHFPTTTRESSKAVGRITSKIDDGTFFELINRPPFDPERDRVMICGSMSMLQELKAKLEAMEFKEGSISSPGQFVIERAFVD